jgi:hypothetical protein
MAFPSFFTETLAMEILTRPLPQICLLPTSRCCQRMRKKPSIRTPKSRLLMRLILSLLQASTKRKFPIHSTLLHFPGPISVSSRLSILLIPSLLHQSQTPAQNRSYGSHTSISAAARAPSLKKNARSIQAAHTVQMAAKTLALPLIKIQASLRLRPDLHHRRLQLRHPLRLRLHPLRRFQAKGLRNGKTSLIKCEQFGREQKAPVKQETMTLRRRCA